MNVYEFFNAGLGRHLVSQCEIARNSDPLRGGFRVQF